MNKLKELKAKVARTASSYIPTNETEWREKLLKKGDIYILPEIGTKWIKHNDACSLGKNVMRVTEYMLQDLNKTIIVVLQSETYPLSNCVTQLGCSFFDFYLQYDPPKRTGMSGTTVLTNAKLTQSTIWTGDKIP